jgi:serine protease AprX
MEVRMRFIVRRPVAAPPGGGAVRLLTSNLGSSRVPPALVAVAVAVAVLPLAVSAPAGGAALSVVVRGATGDVGEVAAAVASVGGEVTAHLDIIDGVAATVPAVALDALEASRIVASVSLDAGVSFHAAAPRSAAPAAVTPAAGAATPAGGGGAARLAPEAAAADLGSLHEITQIIGAQESWKAGYTGAGVDIALIDTGVSPVPGLTSGNVVNGPDLSFDSQDPDRTHLDGYGHGTHMASLIVGRDRAGAYGTYADPAGFTGVAPDSRLVSVKVGAADGATDVSQVIAAIEWVVEHGRDDGLNIRVLSLSFGTDSLQDASLDPLVFAAEVAWRAGIVVVVSGGNDGSDVEVLANPARSPLLLAVGASDPMGTLDPADDTVPEFATRGEASRHVDVVAPGVHVLGLRTPGSTIDRAHPAARVGTRFFRGSGTSQAAAITAGTAALLLQRHPAATPDQVKAMLSQYATPLKAVSTLHRGHGSVQVHRAQVARLDSRALQSALPGSGLGSLEAARGSAHVADDGVELTGEVDIFGTPWDPATWVAGAAAGTNWDGGTWNGTRWTGDGWTGTSWAGRTWTGETWTGGTWTGRTWTDASWTGRTWTAEGWVDDTWSGRTWTGRTWTGAAWSTGSWS